MKKILLLLISFSIAGVLSAQVRITEIHYDNAGGDTDEGVEVSGVAGTDLAGWSIVLYNGNDGSSYGTINLNGIIPDEGSGFGALAFFQAGIQNGAPDGLALVDNNGIVVEFLSYEGNFIADGGPADGISSTDIGVDETSSTPIGESLQRTDAGTWTGPATSSFGSLNTGINTGFLPIELTYFTATPKSNVIALNWRTETELNNAYMAVERSLDGENFAEIGRVKGAGTTVEPQEYRFIDEAPKAGINYYRLRQVDTDGTVNYHKVVAVSFDTKDIATTVFPTVANDFVTLQTSKVAEAEGIVTVMSLTGKIVTELAFAEGANQIELNVANLAAGQYFVRLAVDGAVTTTRFVKQ